MTPAAQPRIPIRVLVVDDEALARRNLTLLLERDPDIASVSECGSGAEALEAIRRSRPELVFLDVQMPECDGFDVLEMLGADLPETVIFVTAYAAYALRAFEAGALDYILSLWTTRVLAARSSAPREGSLADPRTMPTRSIGLQ